MAKAGCHPSLIRAVAAMYGTVLAAVTVRGAKGRTFELSRGVRQGCPLSPLLFLLYINPLALLLRERGCGVPLGPRKERVAGLLFADDTTQMGDTAPALQRSLDVVTEYTDSHRLLLSAEKSQVLVVAPRGGRKPPEGRVTIYGKPLQVVDQAKVLGVEIAADLSSKAYIQGRTKSARMASLQLCRAAGRVGGLPPRLMVQLWRVFGVSRVMYGAAVYPMIWNVAAERALESVQRGFGCQVLQCSSQASSALIHGDLGLVPLQAMRERAVMIEWGRLLLMPASRLVRRVVLAGKQLAVKRRTRPRGIWYADALRVLERLTASWTRNCLQRRS